MSLPTSACDEYSIERFLEQRMTADEESAFALHLDDCEWCCRRLDELTAVESHWSDVATHLVDETGAVNAANECTRDHGEYTTGDVSLSFLGPTDDPHMLGRFAGYEIAGVIGAGGMGIVLKGFDRALNRFVAIKVLQPHFASNAAARQRFSREARAAAAVVHDNVIAIHGVHVDAQDALKNKSALVGSAQLPYLVMPYIRGESLQQRLDRCGCLQVDEILRISLQVALGLAAAHEQGLVHRDIKPANVLLPADVERVKITDFGLARAADDASLTRSGVIAGTPQYMSPEQALGHAIGTPSDLFSLGSLIYAMAAGRLPFRAETPLGVLRRIIEEEPRDLREINPNIPDWLCQLVRELHRKSPEDRPGSAAEVADRLKRGLANLQQPTIELISEPTASNAIQGKQQQVTTGTFPFKKGVIVTMAIATTGLLAAVIWFVGNLPNEPTIERQATEQRDALQEGQSEGRTYTKEFKLQFADPQERGVLKVDIKRGQVRVTGHEGTEILVRLTVPDYDAPKDETASELKAIRPSNLDFEIEGNGNEIKLDSNSQRYLTNLEILVPRRINLDLDSYEDGGIVVRDVEGELKVRSHRDNLELINVAGSATVWTYNGSIAASFAPLPEKARLSFESYNGDISVQLPETTGGLVRFRSGSGKVFTDFDVEPQDAQFERESEGQNGYTIRADESVSGRIGNGSTEIRIDTEQGDVEFTRRSNSSTSADASTSETSSVDTEVETTRRLQDELAANLATYEEISGFVDQNKMPEYLRYAALAGVLETRREIALADGRFADSRKLVGQLIIAYEKAIQSYEAMMGDPDWQARFPDMDEKDMAAYRRRLEYLNSRLEDTRETGADSGR